MVRTARHRTGVYRVALVLRVGKPANSFATTGRDLAPFGQRLTRARDNCFETLPLFARWRSAPSSPAGST